MSEGFTLNAAEIAEKIHTYITRPGWHLETWLDSYRRPDFDGAMMVHDPVDRSVVVFVGSREEAAAVADAARRALG